MDGRPHPQGDELNPTWLGHSVGHWEGDTLVVDVVGYNEGGWIDMVGDPRTNLMHIVERFTRKDLYTLRYEATIDDPGAYTEPWTIGFDIVWDEKGELQEYICQENSPWMRRLFIETRDSSGVGSGAEPNGARSVADRGRSAGAFVGLGRADRAIRLQDVHAGHGGHAGESGPR
jgi:hypothetical protein